MRNYKRCLPVLTLVLLMWTGLISVANADNLYRVWIGDPYVYVGPFTVDDDSVKLAIGGAACEVIAANAGHEVCAVTLNSYGGPVCWHDNPGYCGHSYDPGVLVYSNGYNCGTGSYQPATGSCIADPPPQPEPETPLDLSRKNFGSCSNNLSYFVGD